MGVGPIEEPTFEQGLYWETPDKWQGTNRKIPRHCNKKCV